MITQEFIEQYLSEKEALITQYLPHTPDMTLRKASDYLKKLSDNMFGNESHGGIVQYLSSQPSAPKEVSSLLKMAERYFSMGWHIAFLEGRYLLLSAEFKRVADVTGPATIRPTVSGSLTVEDASKFLVPKEGELLKKAAQKQGIKPAMLKSPSFTLEMVKKYYPKDIKIKGIAKNYSSLGSLLGKLQSYTTQDPANTVSLEEIYELGYRLTSTLLPSDSDIVTMSNGTDTIIIRKSFEDEGNNIKGFNLLSEVTSEYIVQEKLIELAEFDSVYGVVIKTETLGLDYLDYSDNERLLGRVFNEGMPDIMPDEYLSAFKKSISTYILARVFLFGDDKFTLNSFCINPVNSLVYSRYTGSLFTLEESIIATVSGSYRQYAGKTPLMGVLSQSDKESATYYSYLLASLLPYADLETLKGKLKTIEFPEEYAFYKNYMSNILDAGI